MKPKVYVMWFRNDLRLRDNLALALAAKLGPVIGLYCWEPRFDGETDFEFPAVGAFRRRFILESVADLRAQLAAEGVPLYFREAEPSDAIDELSEEYDIQAIYAQTEVGPDETAALGKVQQLEIPVRLSDGWTMVHPEDLPYPLKHLPILFTNFQKDIERKMVIRRLKPLPEFLPVPTLLDLGELPELPPERSPFPGGETAGLARIQHYLWDSGRVLTYKATRNEMLDPESGTRFSPYLAHGCISPRHIFHEIQKIEPASESAYWVIYELLWRDFFHLNFRRYGRKMFKIGGIKGSTQFWNQDRELFEKWSTGTLEVPLVDAAMRELRATGYMSNRARQITASYWAKDLQQDWRIGAEWFQSLLVDYDPHSNWGNWQYVAGVGNDARSDRRFNLTIQAEKYDPNGEFVTQWLGKLDQ